MDNTLKIYGVNQDAMDALAAAGFVVFQELKSGDRVVGYIVKPQEDIPPNPLEA